MTTIRQRAVAAIVAASAVAVGACDPRTFTRPTRAPVSYVMRYECPVDGTAFYYYTNAQGYHDLSPAMKAQCSPIPPTEIHP